MQLPIIRADYHLILIIPAREISVHVPDRCRGPDGAPGIVEPFQATASAVNGVNIPIT